MFVVLEVYDDTISDYRHRHIVIGAGTMFYPIDYNDIDRGTIVNNYGSLIRVREPIDQVAIKMNKVYTEAYSLFILEMQGFIKKVKKPRIRKNGKG